MTGRSANDAGTLQRFRSKHQASGRDVFAQFDEAVKTNGQRHQGRLVPGPDIGNGAWLFAMSRPPPQFEATLFHPGMQRSKVWDVRHPFQHLVTSIPDVLIDLALLPPCRRSAKVRLMGEQPTAL